MAGWPISDEGEVQDELLKGLLLLGLLVVGSACMATGVLTALIALLS
jgi:hypothetical protein